MPKEAEVAKYVFSLSIYITLDFLMCSLGYKPSSLDHKIIKSTLILIDIDLKENLSENGVQNQKLVLLFSISQSPLCSNFLLFFISQSPLCSNFLLFFISQSPLCSNFLLFFIGDWEMKNSRKLEHSGDWEMKNSKKLEHSGD
jgi:hypothetical protein